MRTVTVGVGLYFLGMHIRSLGMQMCLGCVVGRLLY